MLCGFLSDSSSPRERPMGSPAVTALTQRLLPLVWLSKSRTETLAMLTPGMISARTVNLAHLAP